MEPSEFIEQLSEAQDFIKNEKYKNALNLLYSLREIEREGDFDYNLTHTLYQLISNAESLLNQAAIIEELSKLTQKDDKNEIDFNSLHIHFKTATDLTIEPELLKREIELLILRDKIPYRIKGNKLVFT